MTKALEATLKDESPILLTRGLYYAMESVIRAVGEEHGSYDHEPECPLCVAYRKLEARRSKGS